MIRSMTGFGEASASIGGAHYHLELRSLNGKYFKGTIRLPEEFQGLEPELDAELRRRLTRGTITLIGKCSDTSESAAYEVNAAALSRYIDALRRTPQVADGSCTLEIGPLLALPGVLQPPSNEEDRFERAREAFLKLLDRACADLIRMREKEGQLLVADLMSHHAVITGALERIRAGAPRSVEEYERRLRQRIDALLQDAKMKVDTVDLIREVAVYAERSDISEEIARLTGHLLQFAQMLSSPDDRPLGRTLDFLAQEMLRETNTIASKSADAEISRAIVEAKGAIDRIKEQVQNVE